MSSTADAQLALLGAAIDELAEVARTAAGGAEDAAVAQRLAVLWAMVADLDPGLAQRLPGYATAGGSLTADAPETPLAGGTSQQPAG